MGTTYRITDGTSSVDISPVRGQNDPENRGREVMVNKAGVTDAHDWGGKNVYELPFNGLSKARADQLIAWWENLTVLTFTPDLQGDAGTTKSVLIDEVPRPVQMWGGNWDTLFAGLLTLYEVSSISFSSSSQSVSASKSCSVPSASQSFSIGSTSSCANLALSSRSSFHSTSCSSSGSLSVGSCDDPVVSSSCSSGESTQSCSTASVSQSCETSTSYSDSCSVSSGVSTVSFASRSCSIDPSVSSFSTSEGSTSCSVSGAG